MPISEHQLDIWEHQGAVTGSAATYDAIRRVLLDPQAPHAQRDFDVFLQGSYGNDTNIHADSDVDIVICLTSTYYEDIRTLSASDRALHDASWSQADYGWTQFKADVADWLRLKFGTGVDPSGKAIFVPGGHNRRNADVLACAEHHHYHSYAEAYSRDYWPGICFWAPGGGQIVNYPKQHSDNCTAKHQQTGGWFKPAVRILKNMRNAMVRYGYLGDGVAASYFLEGMVSNVPNALFGYDWQTTIEGALDWLATADRDALTCANGIHYLVRDGHGVCWPTAHFQAYLAAARRYWQAG